MKHCLNAGLFTAALGVLAVSAPAVAQITVKEPWVRATVAAQKATGAFMQISSMSDAKLVEEIGRAHV